MGFFDDVGKRVHRLKHGLHKAMRIGKKHYLRGIHIGKRIAGTAERLGKRSADAVASVRQEVKNAPVIGDYAKQYENVPIPQLGGLSAGQVLTGVEQGLRLGGKTAGGVKRILGSRNRKEALVNTARFASNEGADLLRAISAELRRS